MKRGLGPVRLAIAFSLLAGRVHAVEPDEVLPDPALEARARAISAQMRCLVCQNQSIDDSDAALARDLRLLIRERVRGGDSDVEIRAYLVGRYGEFVLLKPTRSRHTVAPWLGPAIVLVGAGLGLLAARRRRGAIREEPLSGEEEARIRAISEGRESSLKLP